MRYADLWSVIVPRLGRWVDMENDYRNMDASYTESVWWIFKKLYDKGLIYDGFKSMSLCPRCETTLSNFEVAQGYKDITDISVYVKFRLSGNVGNSNNIQENIYLLAWTTTPWTLPGNVALAIGSDIDYVKIKINNELYILAKSRLLVLKDTKYDIIEEFKGSVLVGMSYEPLFDYYSKNQSLKNIENGWKIYGADFVTTEDGTGIVHIAPAFGSDDYELLKKNSLPFVQHVATDGTFRKEVTDFVGLHVKPIDNDREKDAHQKTDIEIIKWLAHNNKLFSKEKIVHSYPHCWRCDTPLLNYAASSWFVKVTDIKDQLITENNKVVWVPKEVGEGRFGNWLMGARDWAISRSRFWGAPIPVWREEGNGGVAENVHVIGSIDDIRQYSRAKNTYYVMRHGLAENNTKNILDARIDTKYSLTEQGHRQVEEASIELKDKKIDLIVCSPVLRTIETANIVADKLGLSRELVIKDQELGEYNAGIFDGKSVSELGKSCVDTDRFIWRPKDGENYADIKKRMGDFIYSVDKKYSGKTILLVTHETPALLLFMASFGAKNEKVTDYRPNGDFMKNAEIRKLDFIPLPHNVDYELDLHRPFIDDIELMTKEGKRLTRVPDVFDCWFESGSMPYASKHYPFENLDVFEPGSKLFRNAKGFPADFIAEGVDQTRGWFYSMLVLGVALFGKSPYKKVIVNGLVLAEDGEKMAKRKQNYPDPMDLVQKYGADSLRYYLLSSPVVHGQDLCF
ncbi:MAG: class I tRNA ligase family protein, partial [Candidatus Taylorbacteria bacterium]